MTFTPRFALISAGLLLALPALAVSWEWDDEIINREWRQESLNWASNSHIEQPSPLVLLATTAPPPREMWCVESTEPTPDDCDVFDALLTTWTRDFLNIPGQDPVPLAALNNFPAECSSICN